MVEKPVPEPGLPYGRNDEFESQNECLLSWLLHEPNIFHAPAVKQAVDHDRQPLQLRLPACCEPVVEKDRSSTVLLHYFARLFAVLADIGTVARQCSLYFGRHPPNPLRRRLHGTADIAVPLGENLNEAFAVERQGHCPANLWTIERGCVAVHDQI